MSAWAFFNFSHSSVIQYILFVYKRCCYVFMIVRHRQTDFKMLFVILSTFSHTDPVFKDVNFFLLSDSYQLKRKSARAASLEKQLQEKSSAYSQVALANTELEGQLQVPCTGSHTLYLFLSNHNVSPETVYLGHIIVNNHLSTTKYFNVFAVFWFLSMQTLVYIAFTIPFLPI